MEGSGMLEGYKELLNSIELHKNLLKVAKNEFAYNKRLFDNNKYFSSSRADTTQKDISRIVEDLQKWKNIVYIEEERLKYLEEKKETIDECIEQSDITVKVAQLRALGLTQEQVAELIDRTDRQVRNIEKKLREG